MSDLQSGLESDWEQGPLWAREECRSLTAGYRMRGGCAACGREQDGKSEHETPRLTVGVG